jgi:pimeloyl-ACP methyl ester carboxylesterase
VSRADCPEGEPRGAQRDDIPTPSAFADIAWQGQRVAIEHAWFGRPRDERGAPLIVFLHEGLGSVSTWRGFPAELCDALGARGLAYSRPGYGRSGSLTPEAAWAPDFMHRQAEQLLPALLAALDIDAMQDRPWLFGHSDGGSIALLYAAHFPDRLAGAIVLAPHIMVEDLSVASIEAARDAYADTDLRERLARHHDDPDRAFRRWNRIWLDPAFRDWSIEAELATIRCPLLAVQGLDDEYGTLAQIRGIRARLPRTELLELADCRHSPQRDQPQAVIAAVQRFIERHPG